MMKITLKTGKVIDLTLGELNELCAGIVCPTPYTMPLTFPYFPQIGPAPTIPTWSYVVRCKTDNITQS